MDLDMHEINKEISREILAELDTKGTILDVSSNCYNISGYSKNELVGTNIYNYIVDGNLKLDLIDTDNQEIIFKNKAGVNRIFDSVITPIRNNHTKYYNRRRMSLIDISKYKEIEELEKKYRMILEHSKDMIYLYELQPEKRFGFINHAVENILGKAISTQFADPLKHLEMIHPDDYCIQVKKLNGTLDYTEPTQIRFKDSKGDYIWCEDVTTPFYNEDGELTAILGFCRNIQDRKAVEEKLEEIGFYDCLTGLYSRTYYQQQRKRLNDEENNPFAILVCDLDNLKDINDNNGHTYGDRILIKFAKLLNGVFGQEATIARLGGDEYVILLTNISEEFVRTKYFELIMTLDFYNKHNEDLPIMVSIGWAFSSKSKGVFDKYFQLADNRMYENKLSKRNNN